MPPRNDLSSGGATANINLKVSDDERWAFKEWCARNRMSHVDAFRRAFKLLQEDVAVSAAQKKDVTE